jgi:glycosyltransferase involved in cell wall biosynthesis
MPKPRLVVLGSTFPKTQGDGTPSFVLDLAIEQAKEFDVTVLTPMVPGAKELEFMGGVQVKRYKYFPGHALADGAILDNLKAKPALLLQVPFLFLGLYRALKKELKTPATIHAHWVIPQGLVAALFAKRNKLLVTTHGGDIYALNNPLLLKLKTWVLKRAHAITTVNRESKTKLISMGIEHSKISILPMGVDTAQAAKARGERTPGKLVVVGRLVEKKGIQVLIEALRPLKGYQLEIVGDGPWLDRLKEQAKGLNINFLGKRSKADVLRIFGSAAIVLVPSITAQDGDQEGLPVTLLEAAATGAYVIASDLPGINEVIVDGVTGALVRQGEVAALRDAIELGLADGELREANGKALAIAVQRFDHGQVGQSYNSLLKGL